MDTKTLQRHLHRIGFDPGACDGIDGPHTQAALSSFLASKGYTSAPSDALDVDAIVLEASMHVVDGIDASGFQGHQDWSKLSQPFERDDIFAPRGFEFGIFKASEGVTNDSTFADHANACKAAGKVTIAYHFFSPLSHPPGPQIDVLAQQCGRVGLQNTIVALDVEATPFGMQGQALMDWFTANRARILDNLRAAIVCCVGVFGKKPLIYTYPYYWMSLGSSALTPEWGLCPLWLSAPSRGAGVHKPIAPWASCAMHQWTDDANVVVPIDGYGGPHVLADRFAGTLAELRALT